jgi:hypothetical protein
LEAFHEAENANKLTLIKMDGGIETDPHEIIKCRSPANFYPLSKTGKRLKENRAS